MAIYINGEETKIPLDQLIAEGKEIIERESLPPPKTKGFEPDLWAASVAVTRYDEAHRQWVEAEKNKED